MPVFVAVHAGAGNHSISDRKALIDLCKLACAKGISNINETYSAVDACAAATVVLEDSPLVNAGLGSNLTSAKTVECDASLMDGCTLAFSGIGAVSCVKNPILLSREILRQQETSNCCEKLISPLILCGLGALEFAKTSNVTVCKDDELITSKALLDYKNCRKILRKSENATIELNTGESHPFENCRFDTVGCVAVDSAGNVSASCSSGGVLFKRPGRIGQAACYGCGCWAENTPTRSVAISVSGCGEYLIRTHFARSCAEALLNCANDEQRDADDICSAEIVNNFFRNNFVHSKYLRNSNVVHKIAGAIIVVVDRVSDDKFCTEFIFVHNTKTMCLAYGTCSESDKITGVFSKSKYGHIVVCGNVVK